MTSAALPISHYPHCCYCYVQVSGFQVAAQPTIYVLDTPGVMMPAVPSDEIGFKLALAGEQSSEAKVAVSVE
jgi:ribosome biogenesis GTPase A